MRRLGFPVSYVFSCTLLQASWGELVPRENCRFLLHAFIWCHCIDWNCSSRGDDTVFVRVVRKNNIPEQLLDVYDGKSHFCIFVVKYRWLNRSQIIYIFFRFTCGANRIPLFIWVSWACLLSLLPTFHGCVSCIGYDNNGPVYISKNLSLILIFCRSLKFQPIIKAT